MKFDPQTLESSLPQSRPTILIPRKEVSRRLGVAVITLAKWACKGYGPPCIRLSASKSGYREEDVEAWIRSRAVSGSVPSSRAA